LTVLVPCVVPKLAPAIVTELPARPDRGERLAMMGGGFTVKIGPTPVTPPTVTSTLPVVAAPGTWTTILALLQLVGVPNAPLKLTVLVPCVLPKPDPLTVTDVPTSPDDGEVLVTLSVGEVTVNSMPLVGCSDWDAVSTMLPVVAPGGTTAHTVVLFHVVAVANDPLNVTEPWGEPKLVPVILTGVPGGPDVGDKLSIPGPVFRVKAPLLLVRPLTETVTLPDCAAAGTGTTIAVLLQLDGVAVAPRIVTVLVPFVAPKPAPEIVSGIPIGPELGDTTEIEGDVTVKLTPLLTAAAVVRTICAVTLPVLAPLGTDTTIVVAVMLDWDATVPLNITSAPWLSWMKFEPVIVTCCPNGPEVEDKLVIVGGWKTLKAFTRSDDGAPLTVTTA
jgi:hypothetical protein